YRRGETVPPLPAATSSLIDRMRARQAVRVGYFDDSLPFAYFNGRGDLVGLDVEMAQQFGHDLNLAVEFVPLSRAVLDTGLDPAGCDLVMSRAVVSDDRAVER